MEGLPRSAPASPVLEAALDPRDRRGRWAKVGVIAGLALGATAAICRLEVSTPSARSATSFSGSSTPVQVMAATAAADGDQPALSTPRASTTPAIAPLAFKAVNFYHVRDGKPALDYPWLKDVKLIEPHRETTLTVIAPREGYEYNWQIRAGGSASDVHTSASGAEAVVVLDAQYLDENLVTLEEVKAETGVVVRRLDEFVMVKYVRREIRTLTDDEREELFDAVSAFGRCIGMTGDFTAACH